MDSTATLTTPMGHPSFNSYIFTPNSVTNTTLFDIHGGPLYAITTRNLVSDTHTCIDDTRTGRRVATIVRHSIFPDTVRFSDQRYNSGKPINMHKWLKKGKLPDGYPVHLMQTPSEIGPYVWKSDSTQRLGLYRGNDGLVQLQCLAYLQPASQTDPLMLLLDPTAEPIRDEILVACLILEQRLRVMERNMIVGSGKFEMNRTVFGHYVLPQN